MSSRVPITNSVRKTIHHIKEITGNPSEEEIYAMLKECSMDPNETAQKLLLQDTFHEVKRKRDKKKENLSTRESGESRSRPGIQGHGRGSRGNYTPRITSHDAVGAKKNASGKQNGSNQVSDKGVSLPPLPISQEAKNKEVLLLASSVTDMANGPTAAASVNTGTLHNSQFSSSSAKQPEVSSALDTNVAVVGALPLPTKVTAALGSGKSHEIPALSSSNSLASKTPTSSSTVCFSSSDPVLVPSHDPWLPGAVGTIKREVGSQRASVDLNATPPTQRKSPISSSEVGTSLMQGEMPTKPEEVGNNQLIESSQPLPASTHVGSTVNRPLSGYSSRSQQLIGPPKVPSKEWKPKPLNHIPTQGSAAAGASEALATSVETDSGSLTVSSGLDSKEATSKVQRKLEDLRLLDWKHSDQHVIIPNHIHVPESERTKFIFGSIDPWYGSNTQDNGPECDKSSIHTETTQDIEETEEQPSSLNALESAEEGDYTAHPQASTRDLENLSSVEKDVPSSAVPEYNEPKLDTAQPLEGHQYSTAHANPSYSVGSLPPILGTQIAPFESSDSQVRDLPRLPGIVVQQSFDPTSYYAQLYRSNVDSDGRISPFQTPGVATKYNGNVAVLNAQSSQSSQEVGNSLVLSTAGPTPLVTQAAGVMQSSIAVTQQPVPVFRQPTGLHISHYPPNYIPYGHYFSPIYVPPPAIHQFLSNGAFPQQPQPGSMYHPPPPAATTGVKYSLSQYKPGTNMGNNSPLGMVSSYGSYGSAQGNYNPSAPATTGNSTANEDLVASQFKESNVYVTGQQSEGSAVWVAAPGRDIPGLQANSFYNLPTQGQHMTFTPTQAGHGTFASIYHPGQAVTAATIHPLLQQSQTMAGGADMGPPTGSVFQQPQHAQMNWPNSY